MPAVRYVLLLVALLFISFALPRALPGDPLASLSSGGGLESGVVLSPQARAQLTRYYGLDQPMPLQAARFLGETLRGDLGFSISFSRPVATLILDRLPWTILLVSLSLLLASVGGCLLGLAAAVRHDSSGFRRAAVGLLLAGSLPDFVLGILLILALGVFIPLLPITGGATEFQSCRGLAVAGCAVDVLQHAALPVLTLTLVQLPAFFLLMRAAALGELGQPYIVAARARGLRERTVALRHMGKNALLPVLTLVGLRLGSMLGGVVVVEALFAYPGLGQLGYQAALSRDFPVLQALFLLGGVAILLFNAGADLARRRLDPRLRLQPA